jgi:DTW domain-containing protein YfiP
MLHRLCICAAVPRIENDTRLVLIIHRREIVKPTNTGALAARCLAQSEVHVRGAEGQPIDYARIAPPNATNLYLFPAEDAEPLTPELCATLARPVRLIVPDGNWGQAARVGKRIRALRGVRYVTLPPGAPTQYGLRREAKPRPEGLATLEAISRALRVLDGPRVSDPLDEIFRIMVSRSLWSRGKVPAAAVYGGLPPASP